MSDPLRRTLRCLRLPIRTDAKELQVAPETRSSVTADCSPSRHNPSTLVCMTDHVDLPHGIVLLPVGLEMINVDGDEERPRRGRHATLRCLQGRGHSDLSPYVCLDNRAQPVLMIQADRS